MLGDLLSELGVLEGGLKVALPWSLLSTGDNGITVDSIVVSGWYMNVIALGAWLLSRRDVLQAVVAVGGNDESTYSAVY